MSQLGAFDKSRLGGFMRSPLGARNGPLPPAPTLLGAFVNGVVTPGGSPPGVTQPLSFDPGQMLVMFQISSGVGYEPPVYNMTPFGYQVTDNPSNYMSGYYQIYPTPVYPGSNITLPGSWSPQFTALIQGGKSVVPAIGFESFNAGGFTAVFNRTLSVPVVVLGALNSSGNVTIGGGTLPGPVYQYATDNSGFNVLAWAEIPAGVPIPNMVMGMAGAPESVFYSCIIYP